MSDTRRGTVESAPKGLSLQAQPMSAPKGPVGKTQAKPATERSERRGAVILIQRGDPEIAGAIAEGMLEGRKPRQLPPEQMKIVVSALKELRAQAQALKGQDVPVRAALPEGQDSRGRGSAASCEVRGAWAEIDRQKIVASLVRVAVANDKDADDYSAMITKARYDYRRYYKPPGTLRRFARKLLGAYGLLCYAAAAAYKGQDRVLGRR